VRLQSCFHFPLRVLKTAPSNRDGQLLANSIPEIIFQPETAIFRDAGDHLQLHPCAVIDATPSWIVTDPYLRPLLSTIPF
jgi:hypothetical protein